jgi:drug/metabolite transporter (DMT)-like permease
MYSPKTFAYIALALICIIWGTTYTAIKIAVDYFPTYLMVGIRQTGAGIIILTTAYLSRQFAKGDTMKFLTRRYLLAQAITGVFMITGGNGFITWGMQYVSSGLASVIGSLTPVLVLLINMLWYRKGESTSWYTFAGVLLGFAGLGFVFHEGWADFTDPNYKLGILGCFCSCLAWALGTVMGKRFNHAGVSPMINAGLQITAGGLGGFVMSLLFDHNYTIHHSWHGWGALFYLMFIGSAVAFTLYMFVLKQLSATASSIYTYINPAVAVFLGWLWLGESMSLPKMMGMCITLAGVWLVNKGESQKK